MNKCIGYSKNYRKCCKNIDNDKLFCSDIHIPKNYNDIIQKCNICCDKVEPSDIIILTCNHAHHKQCLLLWINSINYRGNKLEIACPLCRKLISTKFIIEMNNI